MFERLSCQFITQVIWKELEFPSLASRMFYYESVDHLPRPISILIGSRLHMKVGGGDSERDRVQQQPITHEHFWSAYKYTEVARTRLRTLKPVQQVQLFTEEFILLRVSHGNTKPSSRTRRDEACVFEWPSGHCAVFLLGLCFLSVKSVHNAPNPEHVYYSGVPQLGVRVQPGHKASRARGQRSGQNRWADVYTAESVFALSLGFH